MLGAVGLALVIQGQTATLETDPGVVVSKLLAKYYNAATLSGTIVQEVSDGGGKRRITTRVAYIRPGYVFVEQDVRGTNGLNLKLVSDDAKFMYSPPLKTNVRVRPNEMLYEPRVIKRLDNSSLTLVVGDMYHAAHLSLMPNTILDLAIAYGQHMKDFATIGNGSTAHIRCRLADRPLVLLDRGGRLWVQPSGADASQGQWVELGRPMEMCGVSFVVEPWRGKNAAGC